MEKKTLKEWRSARKMTQQELAYKAGISLSSLTDAETFRKSPNIRNAQKIARVLEVGLDEVVWTRDDD